MLFQPHAFAETAVLSLSQGSGMKLDFTTLVFGVMDPVLSYFIE